MDYWVQQVNLQDQDPHRVLRLGHIKYVPGIVKNTHFGLIYRFLPTRSKLEHVGSNINPNCKFCSDPNCKFCSEVENREQLENVVHCFVNCPRIKNFWQHFKRIIDLNMFTEVQEWNKIFGIPIPDKNKEILSNFLLQLAQRAVWQTRNIYEKSNMQKDVWEFFKNLLLNSIKALYKMLLPRTFAVVFVAENLIKVRYETVLDFV